ncbi:MAG: tetratricopeptide repeat protein [Thiobacillaceae bacterium]
MRRFFPFFILLTSVQACANDSPRSGFQALSPSLEQTQTCADALAVFDYAAAQRRAQRQLADAPGDAAARMCAARAAYETGHFTTALEQLRILEQQHPQAELRTYSYNWLTVSLRRLGREDEAMRYGQAALAWARRESSRQNLATALHNMAGLAWARGDAASARAFYLESIPLNPDLSERSASFNNLGLIDQATGRLSEAESWLKQAIALNREHNHFHHLGKHLMNLGNLYREQKRYTESGTLLGEGAALIDRAGDLYWQAVVARYRGWLARDQRNWEQSEQWLKQAVRDYDVAGAGGDAEATRQEIKANDDTRALPHAKPE